MKRRTFELDIEKVYRKLIPDALIDRAMPYVKWINGKPISIRHDFHGIWDLHVMSWLAFDGKIWEDSIWVQVTSQDVDEDSSHPRDSFDKHLRKIREVWKGKGVIWNIVKQEDGIWIPEIWLYDAGKAHRLQDSAEQHFIDAFREVRSKNRHGIARYMLKDGGK